MEKASDTDIGRVEKERPEPQLFFSRKLYSYYAKKAKWLSEEPLL